MIFYQPVIFIKKAAQLRGFKKSDITLATSTG